MKRTSHFLSILSLLITFSVSAQESDLIRYTNAVERNTFGSDLILTQQSAAIPKARNLEVVIQHSFGKVTNGTTDLFGIYGPSNIRMGLNYSIHDRIQVGVGSTKDYKLQDLQAKVLILRQTRNDKMPVSLAVYGNMAIDARNKKYFVKTVHRFSYFGQLILARKFSKDVSVQIAPSFTHYNGVVVGYDNNVLAISAGGKVHVKGNMNFLVAYDQQLNSGSRDDIKPGLAAGVEFVTSTHAFHIYAGNFKGIIPQWNMMYNSNDFADGEVMIAFNIITRIASFRKKQ